MTEEEWNENAKFLNDAEAVKFSENGFSLLVETIKELFPKGTRDSLYKEAEPFFTDFSLEFSPDLTTGAARINYHLVNIDRGYLVTAVGAYLALLCSEYPKAAAKFYKAIGLSDGLVAPPRKYRGDPGTRGAVDDEPATPQLRLSEPGFHDHPSHFSHRAIAMILGREKEQEELRSFVNPRPGFRWLQLAGAGGQGKSRMAYDLMLELGDDWKRGFLHKSALEEFQGQLGQYRPESWTKWQPSKHHLIIIDYIVGYEFEIGYAMDQLAERQGHGGFGVAIRVLLIERQRWDQGSLKVDAKIEHNATKPRFLEHEGISDWFAKMDRHSLNRLDSTELRFGQGVIELINLSPDNLVKIVRDISKNHISESDQDIKKHLHHIDVSGRPLYAYFLAQALSSGQFRRGWEKSDLIEYVFAEHCRKRWNNNSNYTDGSWGRCPKLDEDHPALRLALLATLTGYMDCRRLSKETQWGSVTSLTKQQALALSDGPIDGGAKSVGNIIPALEPDILGEWFVLTALAENPQAFDLLDIAVALNPRAVASFFVRAADDFTAHPAIEAILRLNYSDVIIRNGIAQAMGTLGYNYLLGETIARDERLGVDWLQKAAECGDGLAMLNLGICYQEGCGVEENPELAVKWYLKAGYAGIFEAAYYFGRCLEQGYGIGQREDVALQLYSLACDRGSAAACVRMAELGGEDDPDVAFELLRKAAYIGDPRGMYLHGECYRLATGTKEDPGKAAHWLEKAAIAGYISSMFSIGMCYRNSYGVDENPAIATEWLKKGADAGEPNAMFELGECYRKGYGVPLDLAMSEQWHERAINAGYKPDD